jgi:hypothetical protein
MANHEGNRSESSGQPPSEVCNLQAERVEQWKVEQYAGILGQWGPDSMEYNKKGDANSNSLTPLCKCRED